MLADLVGLIGIALGEGLVELLLQEDFPFGGLALVNAIKLGEPGLLFGGERLTGGGIGLGEAFHGEFVGAFHGRRLPTEYPEDTEKF